ncbi:MAG: hypothetical protein DRP81_09380, partial [Candidatus Omnitrophota bacterium]
FYKLLSKGLIFQERKGGNYYLNKELEVILEKILKKEANEKDLISVLTKEEKVCEEDIKRLISNFKEWKGKLLITENDIKFLWAKGKDISLVRERLSIPQGSLTHSRRRLAEFGLSKNVKEDGRAKLRLSEKGEELLEHLAEGTLTLDIAWKLGISRWIEIEGKGIMLREDTPFNDLNEFLDEYHLLLEGIERIRTKPYQELSERRLKTLCFYYLGIPVKDIARLLDIGQGLVSAYLNHLKEKRIIRKKSEISYELTEEGKKWISAIREGRSPLIDKELEEKIEMVLEETGGNISETARKLGMTRSELRGIIRRNVKLQETVKRSRIERKKKDELKRIEQEARRKRREEILLKVEEKEEMRQREKRWLDFRLKQARELIERGKPGIALRILKNQLRSHQDNPQVQGLIQKAEEEIKRKQDPLNNTLTSQERRKEAIKNELEDKREFDEGEKPEELDYLTRLKDLEIITEEEIRKINYLALQLPEKLGKEKILTVLICVLKGINRYSLIKEFTGMKKTEVHYLTSKLIERNLLHSQHKEGYELPPDLKTSLEEFLSPNTPLDKGRDVVNLIEKISQIKPPSYLKALREAIGSSDELNLTEFKEQYPQEYKTICYRIDKLGISLVDFIKGKIGRDIKIYEEAPRYVKAVREYMESKQGNLFDIAEFRKLYKEDYNTLMKMAKRKGVSLNRIVADILGKEEGEIEIKGSKYISVLLKFIGRSDEFNIAEYRREYREEWKTLQRKLRREKIGLEEFLEELTGRKIKIIEEKVERKKSPSKKTKKRVKQRDPRRKKDEAVAQAKKLCKEGKFNEALMLIRPYRYEEKELFEEIREKKRKKEAIDDVEELCRKHEYRRAKHLIRHRKIPPELKEKLLSRI